jgi:hypothetical protein
MKHLLLGSAVTAWCQPILDRKHRSEAAYGIGIMLRMRNLMISSAFGTWSVLTHSRLQAQRAVSLQAVAKMRNMRLGAVLQGWAWFAVVQSRLKVVQWRIVVRMQKKLSAAALDGWFVHAQEQQVMRVQAIKVSAQSRSVLRGVPPHCVIPTRRCAWPLQLWRRVEHMKLRSVIVKWCHLVAEQYRVSQLLRLWRLMTQTRKITLASAFNSWHDSLLHQVLPIESESLRQARANLAQRASRGGAGCCASRPKHGAIKQVNTSGESSVSSTLCPLPHQAASSVLPLQMGNRAWPVSHRGAVGRGRQSTTKIAYGTRHRMRYVPTTPSLCVALTVCSWAVESQRATVGFQGGEKANMDFYWGRKRELVV